MIELNIPLSVVPFVAVDVETTGLDPQRDEIVEIGAVKVQGGKIVDEFGTLIWIDRTIPFEARRIHGITNDMLVGSPRVKEAMRLLHYFSGDSVLVEHSWKAFDAAFLDRANGTQLEAPYLNTCTLSRRLFPMFPKHSLAECCKRHHILHEQHHRALGDARATAALLIYFLGICSSRYPRLKDLLAVAAVEREEARRSRRR